MNRLRIGLSAATLMVAAAARTQPAPPGQDLFERRCTGCHALDRDKEGPQLGGVYGRVSGSVLSFRYSDALRRAHIVWDPESLEKWLSDPESLVPDNEMAFHVESAAERAGIIAYLEQMR